MKRFIFPLLLMLLPLAAFSQTGESALADQYFQDHEYQSALDLYQKLNRSDPDQDLFITRAMTCFSFLGQFEDGVKFLDKVVKNRPGFPVFSIMKAEMLTLAGKQDEADNLVKEIIYKKLVAEKDFISVGTYLGQSGKTKTSLDCFLQGRKQLHSQKLFAGEIAQLYRALGEYANATHEYLNEYYADPYSLEMVRLNVLTLVNADSRTAVEEVLLAESQKNQTDIGLRTFLYEFYLQVEDFMEAFVQVKSIDRFFHEDGTRVYGLAISLRNNKNYKLSNKALDYIIETHRDTRYYYQAFQDKTINSELEAFESLPVDTIAIRSAVNTYDALLTQFGRTPQFYDAMFRKARLCAFYLFDLKSATQELEQAVALPIEEKQRADANLLLGDIFLMEKEYDKAKLTYAIVAEKFKDGQIGATAKFKEGRMSYFKGDFDIAKARLSSIKDNTSNDISNDAIKLFLTIQDNTGLDSTTEALEMFAQAQLMIFQRDFDPAIFLMDSLMYKFPNHALADEVLWEKANIAIQRNQIDNALLYLDKIVETHGEDILADDALWTKARIYDYNFKNKEKALEFYIEFLKKYPGSLFIVEVRKRIRELRDKNL